MYLPTQSQPVRRTINTEAGAYHGQSTGIGPSSHAEFAEGGVQPDGLFDDIFNVVKTVGPAIPGVLSAFGV